MPLLTLYTCTVGMCLCVTVDAGIHSMMPFYVPCDNRISTV